MVVLSQRVQNLKESETLAMGKKAAALKEQGVAVINLSLGEPDFFIPDFVKDAAKQAIEDNYSYYSPVAGFKDLRQAVASKLKRDNGLEFDFSQIVVSNGAKQSVANVLMALLNPGDEVLLPAPYWVSYRDMVEFFGGVVREIPSRIEDNYKISAAQLEEALNRYPKAKAFLYSNPCNPSGCTYSAKELESFAKLLGKHPQLTVISDEIYEYIYFGKEKLVSLANFEDLKERTVVINGLSKAYAMTGWRLGYLAAPIELAKACDKIQSQVTSGANAIAQRAAVVALSEGRERVQYMTDRFLKRRDHLLGLLNSLPGVVSHLPEGAFYVLPSFASFAGKSTPSGKKLGSARELSMYFLEEAHVALTPGDAFGIPWSLRFSYAVEEDKLTSAVQQIQAALQKLR